MWESKGARDRASLSILREEPKQCGHPTNLLRSALGIRQDPRHVLLIHCVQGLFKCGGTCDTGACRALACPVMKAAS